MLLRDGASVRYGCELDAAGPEEAWSKLQRNPDLLDRHLREGDVIYVMDVYYAIGGDGVWVPLAPGRETEEMYRLIVNTERGLA